MTGLALKVLLVVLLILFPIWIPIVAISHGIYLRRLRRAASAFACLSCGELLGLESIRLADEAWADYMRQLHEQNPGMLLQVVRSVHAICPKCGARYSFIEGERTFAPANDGAALAKA